MRILTGPIASIVVSVFSASVALAADAPPNLRAACANEIAAACPDAAPGTGLLKCVKAQEATASAPCKAALGAAEKMMRGGGGLGAFNAVTGGMSMGAARAPAGGYGGSVTSSASGRSSIEQHRVFAAIPLGDDGADSYSGSLSAASLAFRSSPILSSGTVVPQNFYKIEAGAAFSRRLEGDQTYGARFTLGSATDLPFASLRDMTFSAMGHWAWPGSASETSHWVATVFVSNNNPILNYVPIPGFIYFYRTEGFIGMFGLPFASIYWTPIEPWSFALSLFGPTIGSEIAVGPRDGLQGFVGYGWTQQSFLRSDRTRDEDRLFLDEQRASIGARMPVFKVLTAELQAGQTFGRSVYEGPRWGKRDSGETKLDDAWFVGWNLKSIF